MAFFQRFNVQRGLRRIRGINRMMPGLIASTLVVTLMKLNAWAPLERVVNNQMLLWQGARDWDSRIVMISVDDKTLRQFGQFPISRNYYAELLWILTREDTSVVAFNFLFSDHMAAGSNLQASSAANARFAAAMSGHGRVVIGQTWGRSGEELTPVPVLLETALATGHLRLPLEPDDVTRRIDVTVEGVPALGIAAVQTYSLNEELLSIPTESRQLRINWPGPARELATLSLVDVLNGKIAPNYLKDKIVVVSHGATTGQGQIRTPFDRQTQVSGGYMHAAVIDNLLNQNWLRLAPENSVIIALLTLGPLFGWLLYREDSWMQLFWGVLLCFIWLLVCFVSLQFSYLMPVVTPIMAIAMIDGSVVVLSRLQSNAMLQVRSAFLNTMSHEIRTPLNAIVNLSEMLQETPLDERQREFADTLNNSSQTLLALINDVLDFSKIESGRLMLEEYPVSLHETIERSIEILAPRAAEKGLELVYSIAPSTPAVIMSDPVRLQQILLNLLSNAVKFTEVGEISVQVQAEPIQPANKLFSASPWGLTQLVRSHAINRVQSIQGVFGRWLDSIRHSVKTLIRTLTAQSNSAAIALGERERPIRNNHSSLSSGHTQPLYRVQFAISDTGIGIPPEQISQLFKPFSQVSAATTRQYGGTGLGLSISKRLSERMGGDLWVKSFLGEGSTFYFTVQAPVAQAAAAGPAGLEGLQGTRFLLIDRNLTRRERLLWSLQPLGIGLAQATSLSEALTFMANDPSFDGVILDEAIAPCETDYIAALRALRAASQHQQLPVILLCKLKTRSASLQSHSSAKHAQTAHGIQTPESDTTIVWKPIKQASLYQALRAIRPVTVSAIPASQTMLNAAPGRLPSQPIPTASSAPFTSASTALTENLSAIKEQRAALRILIAEDNRINQRVAIRLLEILGYRADIVSSGTEVLKALQHETYDVILMDMRMPELDGLEATRQIRQNAKYASTWIIAMTANAMEKDRQRCLAAGMDDYLSKPIKREALEQALDNCPAMKSSTNFAEKTATESSHNAKEVLVSKGESTAD